MTSQCALVLSVSALLAAITLVVRRAKELTTEVKSIYIAIRAIIRTILLKGKKEEVKAMKIEHKTLLLIIVLLLSVPAIVFTVRATDGLPPNVKMMKEVWDTFNEAKETKKIDLYQEAIEKADILIREYEPGALGKQKQLIQDKVKVPKDGKLSKEDKEVVFSFGTLHEVSAAWWVEGRSFEALGKSQEAVHAFEQAAQYPHALVYDPSWDGFWSPSKDASARLEYMRTNH